MGRNSLMDDLSNLLNIGIARISSSVPRARRQESSLNFSCSTAARPLSGYDEQAFSRSS